MILIDDLTVTRW